VKILSLDISTKTGWAVLQGEATPESVPAVIARGRLTLQDLGHPNVAAVGDYPWSFLTVGHLFAEAFDRLYLEHRPDVIVIEDTSESRNRYAQKILEFLHCITLQKFAGLRRDLIVYIPVGYWRSALELRLSKDDKKNNAAISKAKKTGVSKKSLGLKGKVTKKHLALRFVEATFGLKFKVKDNDIADAICLGVGYLRGARASEGLHVSTNE
jgi:hypothetical protein